MEAVGEREREKGRMREERKDVWGRGSGVGLVNVSGVSPGPER